MAQNSLVSDEHGVDAGQGGPPQPIPDLGIPAGFASPAPARPATVPPQVPTTTPPPLAPVVPATPVAATPVAADAAPVTDDDRQTYGRLLDRAFERGLLGAFDYELRLRELSEATTVDQMRAIVTELPAFSMPAADKGPRRSSLLSSSSSLSGARSGTGPARTGLSGPWAKLAILVVVVVVAFLVLALYAQHLVHQRNGGSGAPPPAAVVAVSCPRL
jgi:hypothetical protein